MPTLAKLFAELQRRKVIRAALAYAVVAWLVIQVAETTFEPLHLPEWSVRLVILIAVAGFPVVAVVAWLYDLTRSGFQRDTGSPTVAAQQASDSDSPSIAVLPFLDMSPDQDQQYFCDGVAEEILNTLTQVEGLRVASRSTSFQYADRGLDLVEIARSMRVKTILEGSVRKAGDRLRVTAQLIDAETGYHLWSDRFEDRTEDVFRIQDEIARRVAAALELSLGSRAEDAQTSSFEAYDYYLKGWNYFHGFGDNSLEFARGMFKRAIEIDPGFARAWAGLADTMAFKYLYMGMRADYRDEAERASKKALELCPSIAETHASRGLAQMISGNYEQANACFERALELNPSLFEPYYFYARSCVHQGNFARAAELFEKAHEIDPDDYQSALLLPQVYTELGQPDKTLHWRKLGVEAALRRLDWQPDDVRAMYLAAVTLHHLDRKEEALELAQRARRLQPNDGVMLYNLACLYAQAGRVNDALDCLDRLTLPGMSNREWIEHDSDLDPIRDHPRFKAILARFARDKRATKTPRATKTRATKTPIS